MYIAQHADSSFKTFGKQFYAVHEYLDQYSAKYRGFAHRRLLHHRLGVELAVKQLGERARGPSEQHIREDTGGELPDDWAFYGEPVLLKLEDYDRQDADLIKLYGMETFKRVQLKIEMEAE